MPVLKSSLHLRTDQKHKMIEPCVQRIEERVLQQCFAVWVYAHKLFYAAKARSDAGGEHKKPHVCTDARPRPIRSTHAIVRFFT